MRRYLLVACMGIATCHAQTPLCDQITTLTTDPSVAAAHWGVMVTTLEGVSVCGINEKQLFRPASNNKLFTTSAALALLGPTRTFETTVTGRLQAGVVRGDLTLVGGGDANLDSGDLPYVVPTARPKVPVPFAFHDLEELAKQLISRGLRTVEGDVVGDDTLFPYEPYGASWAADDFVWGYGAPVSALSIADNQLTLTITPASLANHSGKPGTAAAVVTLEQHGVPYYLVQNDVVTVPAPAVGGVQVERLPGSRMIRVYGTAVEHAAPEVEHIAIDDPAAYAALAFRRILVAHGVAVKGVSRAKHRWLQDGTAFQAGLAAKGQEEARVVAREAVPEACGAGAGEPVLAAHRSASLADDVIFTDKVSQNLHAEMLFHQLGHHVLCGKGSSLESARMVRAFLVHAGVEAGDLFLFDGSGLSAHDLTTPRALAQLLRFDATQSWFADLKAALPVGGVDGSLTTRFGPPDSTLKGRVWAKTGTLGESRALSGYVTTAGGQTLIFSILDDNHAPNSSADRVVMDRIVEAIAAQP